MSKLNSLLTSVLSGVLPMSAAANDTSLYADAAPEDASFVRFVGFQDQTSAEFAGKVFELGRDVHEAYVPVSSAKLQNVEAGSFLTVVKGQGGETTVIAEDKRSNRAKIALVLVNATDRVLDLRLADGSTPVIQDVASMTSGLRAVNPVQISLGVFDDADGSLLARFDVSMKRGQNLTFLADETGVRLVENRFAAVAD